MKTINLTFLILCVSISSVYCQHKKHASTAPASTIKNGTTEILVLKPFDEGVGMWGYKNSKTGKIVIEPAYYEAFPFSFGLGLVSNEKSKMGFINKNGKQVIPLIYNGALPFTEGLAAVNKGKGFDENNSFVTGYWGFIDINGNEVIPFSFTEAKAFSQGLAAVGIDEIWGFIDKSGNEVIPKEYIDAYSFSEGLALVREENGKWGFIDKSGATVIPFKYDFGESFSKGKAKVEINGKSFYINKKGERTN